MTAILQALREVQQSQRPGNLPQVADVTTQDVKTTSPHMPDRLLEGAQMPSIDRNGFMRELARTLYPKATDMPISWCAANPTLLLTAAKHDAMSAANAAQQHGIDRHIVIGGNAPAIGRPSSTISEGAKALLFGAT